MLWRESVKDIGSDKFRIRVRKKRLNMNTINIIKKKESFNTGTCNTCYSMLTAVDGGHWLSCYFRH